ncbi:MAG: hypothetical protein AAF939_01195 [Planctomycetota bacterium]
MKPFFRTVKNLAESQNLIRRRAYGVIEAENGNFQRIQLRPFPKFGSIVEANWLSQWNSVTRNRDNCRLFYNQPLFHRNYLSLSYVESSPGTRLKTFYSVLETLQRVAYIKKSDAIIAELSTPKLTDRFMVRRGWEPFLPESKKRFWIKRFYGDYPDRVIRSFPERSKALGTPVVSGNLGSQLSSELLPLVLPTEDGSAVGSENKATV